eukprot:SM000090S24319  [mRNA]  locus=s90:228288:231108:- [translate_table: standard]
MVAATECCSMRLLLSFVLWICVFQLATPPAGDLVTSLLPPPAPPSSSLPSAAPHAAAVAGLDADAAPPASGTPRANPPPSSFPAGGNMRGPPPALWSGCAETPPPPSNERPPNHGYLLLTCNGGVNQMRAAMSDMVAVARHINVTLVIPELRRDPFWNDTSTFEDVFDVEHLIESLAGEVRIVRALPERYRSMRPPSLEPNRWAYPAEYRKKFLPVIKAAKVARLAHTDARLVNNGLPKELQMLRCRTAYHALRFAPLVERLGHVAVARLRARATGCSGGRYLGVHLNYEMDMLAYTGCTDGCKRAEGKVLNDLRMSYKEWKEKRVDAKAKRLLGLCPLTPEELELVLVALGFDNTTTLYLAAGEVFGGDRRLAALRESFPGLASKNHLLSTEELAPLRGRQAMLAALDYLVLLEADVFVPNHDSSMARMVEGHRRYLAHRTTVVLRRKRIVHLIALAEQGKLPYTDLLGAIHDAHKARTGFPVKRLVSADGRPDEEDYFYSNPHECLCRQSRRRPADPGGMATGGGGGGAAAAVL